MSSRPGVVVNVERPAEGGESPNRYVPWITAQVRVYWPPTSSYAEVVAALNEAHRQALTDIRFRGNAERLPAEVQW